LGGHKVGVEKHVGVNTSQLTEDVHGSVGQEQQDCPFP